MVAILSLFLSMLSALPVSGAMAHPIHIYLDGKNAEVALNEETQTIVVSKNGERLEFPLGHSRATVIHRKHRMEKQS